VVWPWLIVSVLSEVWSGDSVGLAWGAIFYVSGCRCEGGGVDEDLRRYEK